ncbi:MAG: DUF2058 domain-containing protein [Halieaceae bacterium]
MANSLQDQLLKAGLTDKKKLKQADKEKRKQKNVQRRSKDEAVDEIKAEAQRSLAGKAERSRELAQQQNAAAEKKAIAAQIRQLIELNRESRQGADIPYNFSDGKQIKKLFVTAQMQDHLVNGRLAIVRLGEAYEVVPGPVADKISQRDADCIVLRNQAGASEEDEDDPYADYKIPDDLMW